ncbi:MAG: transposase [Anaerolineales bacterium]|nr:transposase [Anaerolineales bacterium]
MNKKKTTQEYINKIIEFRQEIHANGFGKQRDALSEVLDAICLTGALSSFPLLSLSKGFQRQWHSLYKAMERGTLDDEWLSHHLAQQVPQEGIQYYSLDGTAWPRPRARTMDDRQYVYHPTPAINGGSVCVGYPYSLLDWVPEAHRSWSLSVSIKRIPSQMTAGEMGIAQIKELSKSRADLQNVLDIVAADGKYGNAKFLRPLQGQNCGIAARLRRDRVLYRVPEQPKKRKRGRPRVHGKRFAFKEPETWEVPDEVITLEHSKLGQVKLERWNNLHGKSDADVPMDVIRASIHLERDKPPRPIWLAWQAPPTIPSNLVVNTQTIWQAYVHRWPVEPGIRFRKQRLGWTTPQFQHKETGDRWSWLVVLAFWLLFLSRPIVEDHPLPWQKPQRKLTPQRVQQSLPLIFAQFGSPARKPKVRGKPPGWTKGRRRTPKQRFKVVKKQPASA